MTNQLIKFSHADPAYSEFWVNPDRVVALVAGVYVTPEGQQVACTYIHTLAGHFPVEEELKYVASRLGFHL